MCNILTFVDRYFKWKIGSWSLQIWVKNTLDRDLPMMKLLLLFNEFFLYLDALYRNLNFLKQTYTFLHLLTQLSSLSYVCFIRCGIFNFAAAFLFCLVFFILPWLFYFAVVFLFCRSWFFSFAVTFLFCRGFFCFAVAFLFCRGFFVLSWLFCREFLFCGGYFESPWFLLCRGVLFCSGFFVLPCFFGFALDFWFCRDTYGPP